MTDKRILADAYQEGEVFNAICMALSLQCEDLTPRAIEDLAHAHMDKHYVLATSHD